MDKNKVDKLAELLPEGITEESLSEIASVMQGIIEEAVQSEVEALNDKVFAFLSLKREQIKEAALAEIQEENDIYRDAMRYRDLLGIMALDYKPEYVTEAASKSLEAAEEIENDNSVLAQELSEAIAEQKRQANTIQLLESKLKKSDKTNQSLQEQVKHLEEEKESLVFESTEQARVITNDVDKEVKDTEKKTSGNEFLTEEMLRLALDKH